MATANRRIAFRKDVVTFRTDLIAFRTDSGAP
jgi:hypothetical protein